LRLTERLPKFRASRIGRQLDALACEGRPSPGFYFLLVTVYSPFTVYYVFLVVGGIIFGVSVVGDSD
jgi:hypothetical protein